MRLSRRLAWQASDNTWSQAMRQFPLRWDLTVSNPTEVFDFALWETRLLGALSSRESMVYQPHPLGVASTREFLASVVGSGQRIHPDEILLTSSTSEAYACLLKILCDFGDEVLVPVPSYPLFEYLAGLEGVNLVPYRLEHVHGVGYETDFASLEGAISERTRSIIAVHPNNPTGTGASYEEIRRFNALAKRFDLALIVDEVFSDYWLSRPASVPPSWLGLTDVATFVMGGLSKSLLLPQMKLAWTVFRAPDQQALQRAMELVGDTYLSPSLPVQIALPKWWTLKGELQAMVVQRIRGNLEVATQIVSETALRVQTFHGGWTVVLEFPRVVSEDNLVADLARRGVKVFPGYFFDFAREGHMVISLLTPPEHFQLGLKTLLECIDTHL